MPLSLTRNGQSCRVQRVEGTEKLRQRLESLGFTVGSEVTVVSESGGNLIVNVKNSRVAISRGMAHRILV
ncbi:MAG: ferrous iron transport protein A [Treponema sp.]|jgi:ferrous iron transport protein A|nr:ferrous iron transport protein A [Treponema sp.]